MAQNDNEIMRRRFDLDWQRIHLVRLFLKKNRTLFSSCASPSRLHVPKKSDKKPTPARMKASRISIHRCELSAEDGSRAQEHPDGYWKDVIQHQVLIQFPRNWIDVSNVMMRTQLGFLWSHGQARHLLTMHLSLLC